jgi:hypothetical protein
MIHIAVDVKTKKEILALEVTDEKVHDGRKIMPKLIEPILKNNNHIKINSVFYVIAPMIVMRILSIFKIKGFVLLQSRLERIPSSLPKTK